MLAATAQLIGKTRRQNTRRQGDHANTQNRHHRPEQLAQSGHGYGVAITHRRESGHGPPHGLGNGAKGLRLHIALHHVQGRCRQRQHNQHDQKGAGEILALVVKHVEQNIQRGEIAYEFEDAKQSQNAQEAQIKPGHQHLQNGRQEGDQIDNRHGLSHMLQADYQGRLVPSPLAAIWRRLDADPNAQKILG